MESYAPLRAPEIEINSLRILFSSVAGTPIGIMNGLILCIKLYNVLGGIDSDSEFGGISEGDKESISSILDDVKPLGITDD